MVSQLGVDPDEAWTKEEYKMAMNIWTKGMECIEDIAKADGKYKIFDDTIGQMNEIFWAVGDSLDLHN